MGLEDSQAKKMAISLLVGLAYFGVCALLVFLAKGALQIIGIGIVGIAVIIFAPEGFGRHYKLGTYGHFFRFLLILLACVTVIGLIPVMYWTGKRILQMLGYSQYYFPQ